MEKLITITENNGSQVVSARELYQFLGYASTQWKRWYEKNLIKNEFAIENEDYVGFDTMSSGNKVKDFALNIDFAKKISMMARTEKGETARKYFIECEKKVKENKSLSQIDILIQSAQMLKEQEVRLSAVENQVLEIQAKSQTTSNYFTIVGYATLNRISCGLKLASSMGRKASALCKARGIEMETLPDPRFGLIKTYPMPILKEVFDKEFVKIAV